MTGAVSCCTVIAFGQANSRSPSAPCTRPNPECPTPPNGSPPTAVKIMTLLTETIPTRSRSAISRPCRRENTEAPSPKTPLLALATASSMSRTRVTTRVGPNVSSVIARASSGTSTSTIGSMNGGRSDSGPPTTARPPRSSASWRWRRTSSIWPWRTIGPYPDGSPAPAVIFRA